MILKLEKLEYDSTFWGWIKCASYAVIIALSWLMDYLGIEWPFVGLLTAMLAFDWLTGCYLAFKRRVFKSKISISGAFEKFLLLPIPLLIALLFKVTGIDIGMTVHSLFVILSLSEFYSALGNIYQIRTGKAVTEYDAVTAIISFLRKKLISIIKEKTDDGTQG